MKSAVVKDDEAPKPVSPWYNLDWQYVLRVARLPAFKPAALVIAAAPIVGNIGQVTSVSTTGFWLMWCASVASILAFGLTKIACPKLVQEYQSYEDYDKVGHSHRWLVWLFYHNLKQFPVPQRQFKELLDKGVAVGCDAVVGASSVPIMPATAPIDELAYPPVNANRDLYMGFWRNGRRCVLTLEEDDPKIAEKSKELFWITISALLPSRPIQRFAVWALYAVSLSLSIWVLGQNLLRPWLSDNSEALTFGDRIAAAIAILFGGPN